MTSKLIDSFWEHKRILAIRDGMHEAFFDEVVQWAGVGAVSMLIQLHLTHLLCLIFYFHCKNKSFRLEKLHTNVVMVSPSYVTHVQVFL